MEVRRNSEEAGIKRRDDTMERATPPVIVRKNELLNGAANLREDVVGVGPDQADCADDDDENDG